MWESCLYVCMCLCVFVFVCVCICMTVCKCVCVRCVATQNMPHAMKSGERHEVCGVRDSVSKRAGADHHGRSMSPRGTPASQTTAATTASNRTQARHQQCHKCHACHAKWRWMSPSATPAIQTAATTTASNGTQARHQSHMCHPPCKVKVDVTKCHHRQAKWRWMSPSATPATQTVSATTASNGTQARLQSQRSAISARPAKCHVRHTNRRGDKGVKRDPSGPPQGLCHQVPCVPYKQPRRHDTCHAKWRATKCLACCAKWKSMSSSATPATQTAAATTASNGTQVRHQSQLRAISATSATQSEGGCRCHQVPRLRREVKVDVAKCHACHAKWRSMSQSVMPAAQSEGGCHQVPRLPHKQPRRQRR